MFALLVPGLFWGLPSAVTPQDDATVPLGSLLFFADRNPQINTVYPAFHQLLMLPVYGATVVAFRLTGGLTHLSSTWPYGFHDVSFFFSVLIFLTNLVAAIMAVAMLRMASSFVDGERRQWVWAGMLLLAGNGVFVYYARVGNFDMPYLFWWTAGVWFLWGYFFGGRPYRWSVLPAAIVCACAAGSKDQAAALAIGAGLLVAMLSPHKRLLTRRERIVAATGFFAVLALAYAVLTILPHPARWWNHARFVIGPHAQTDVPMSLSGQVWMLGRTALHFGQVFPLPALMVAAVGIWALCKNGRGREVLALTFPLLTYYLLIIVKTRVAPLRFMLPAAVPLFVFFTYGAAFLYRRLRPRYAAVWIACLALFFAWQFAFRYAPLTYAQLFDVKHALTADLPSLVPPSDPLLISRMRSYNFPNRNVYERYRLMMLPQDPIVPPSRHVANVLHPLDPSVKYYLLGTGTAGQPDNTPGVYPTLGGELVREWRLPKWVSDRLQVPVLYEFALYRRTAPLPLPSLATSPAPR